MYKITRGQATDVLLAVERQFKDYVEADSRPTLVEDYDRGSSYALAAPWAVVWEDGPFEWALNAFTDHVDEEVYAQLEEFGADVARRHAKRDAVPVPLGLEVEPVNGHVLGIYPE